MPEQERRRNARPRPGTDVPPAGRGTRPGAGPARSGRRTTRTGIAADGSEVPMRAGTPRIRLDGLPATLRWAVWLIGAEAIGLLVVTAVLLYDAVSGPAQSGRSAAATVVISALMAVILGWLSVALARRRGWARGPAIVLQLLLLPSGASIISVGPTPIGVALIVIGLAGSGTLLAPATRAALEGR